MDITEEQVRLFGFERALSKMAQGVQHSNIQGPPKPPPKIQPQSISSNSPIKALPKVRKQTVRTDY